MSDDLAHHHKVLKQFLDISSDAGTSRKNALSRAAKARDKLLKLSAAQFRELSTDVFDELRRRIDESRSEPDFLLPKLNFHPKRNQARQKLSSLPQSRFRDLVSDISYEIERRHLDHLPGGSNLQIQNQNLAKQGVQKFLSTLATTTSSGPSGSSAMASNTMGQNSGLGYTGGSQNSVAPLRIDSDNSYPELSYSGAKGLATTTRSHLSRNSHSSLSQVEKNSDTALLASYLPTSGTTAGASHGAQMLDSAPFSEAAKSGDSLYSDLATPDIHELPKQAMALQPATVVPTKANMTWSSDEEDLSYGNDQTTERVRRISLSNAFSLNKNKAPPRIASLGSPEVGISRIDDIEVLRERYTALELENIDLKACIDNSNARLSLLETEKDALLAERRLLKTETEYAEMQLELNELRTANAALRLENQNIKTTLRHSKASSRDLSNANVVSESVPPVAPVFPAVTVVSGGSAHSATPALDVNAELRKFYKKLDQISIKPASTQASLKEELLRNEALMWQSKYESAQAKERASLFQLPSTDLQNYVSPTGTIPLRCAVRFFSLVETFVESITVPQADTDLLFEKISSIALAANKICGESSINNSSQADAIREAASHALTATRYYATYPNLMPRVIVERSVSEIAFTVCDHIAVSKLRANDTQQCNESSYMHDSTMDIRPLNLLAKSQDVLTGKEPKSKDLETGKSDTNTGTSSKVIYNTKAEAINKVTGYVLSGTLNKATGVNNTASKSVNANSDVPIQNTVVSNKDAGQELSPPRAVSTSTPLSGKIANVINQAKGDSSSSPINSPSSKETGKENVCDTHPQTKPSILEKVKHYEQRDLESQNEKRSSISSMLSNKSRFSDEYVQTDKVEPEPALKPENIPTRSKSIFQSLRERFTSEPKDKEDGEPKKSVEKEPDQKEKTVELVNIVEKNEVKQESPVKQEKELDGKKPRNNNSVLLNSLDTKTLKDGPDATTKSEPYECQYKDVRDGLNFQGKAQAEPETVCTLNQNGIKEKVKITEEPKAKEELGTKKLELKVEPRVTVVESKVEPEAQLKFNSKIEPKDETKFKPKIEPKVQPLPGVASFAPNGVDGDEDETEYDEEEEEGEEDEARQRQDYRKSMAAAAFNIDLFDIDDPDNTLTQLLLYLEHQTVQVISTIQDLLSAIKKPDVSRGELRGNSSAISEVISQMTEATNTSMNQTRNHQLKEHGSWVVRSLEDCNHRMSALCKPTAEKSDQEFADRHFKQRLAGISFDIAKCTKELVKTVEEASLKEDIAQLDARLNQTDLR